MFSVSSRGRTQRPARHPGRCRLELSRLEDRITPALTPGSTGDDTLPPTLLQPVAAGAGEGGLPAVRTLDPFGGLGREFLAYDASFRGGVRVATGEFNGDAIPDIVTAAGPGGGPHLKVFNGLDGTQLASFYAYDPAFAGGVFV